MGTIIGLALGAWIRFGRACRDFLSPRTLPVLDSEALTWAVRLRGWCGWFLILWAAGRWFEDSDDWAGLFDGSLTSALEHALVIPLLLCVAAVVLPLTAVRGERLAILRSLGAPGTALGVVVVLCGLVYGVVELAPRWTSSLEVTAGGSDGKILSAMLFGILIGTAMMIFLGAFSAALIWGIPAVLRHMFRAHDAHPAYPALLTIALALYSVTMGIVRAADAEWHSPFPLAVQIAFLVGGPLGIVATSVIELHLLRSRCGVSLRRAYWSHA